MTAEEFIVWLKGFVEAANPYNVTPKQWDTIKEKLDTVESDEYYITDEGEVVPIQKSKYLDDWYVYTATASSSSWEIKYENHT
jgi:hypothetical protein